MDILGLGRGLRGLMASVAVLGNSNLSVVSVAHFN